MSFSRDGPDTRVHGVNNKEGTSSFFLWLHSHAASLTTKSHARPILVHGILFQ